MSKKRFTFTPALSVFALLVFLYNGSSAQDVTVNIELSTSRATLEGAYSKTAKRPDPMNLAFRNDYAGVTDIAARISDLKLFDQNGGELPYKAFAPGEYVAEGPIAGWRYTVGLRPSASRYAAAHVSWATADTSVLMLNDLLPRPESAGSARVTLDLPDGWRTFSPSGPTAGGGFNITETDRSVLILGPGWRDYAVTAGAMPVRVLIAGKWQFRDEDAVAFLSEILREYVKAIGSLKAGEAQVAIAPFPVTAPVDQWEADTRGTSILILSSDTPFKPQSIQRLHEQLRHEVFHLWFPNGVNLTGSYDWFYEGFALYQSLKTGVGVNRIRFDDYLDTLTRAYAMDKAWPGKTTLIDASRQRWSGLAGQIYARGMLVAFLCDLALLERSGGKTSVTDLLRDIYLTHRSPAASRDGNEAILEKMRSHPELTDIINRNITGADGIQWNELLERAGLTADVSLTGTRLSVAAKPNGSQRNLLNKLGYNNWRKLTRSSK